MAEDSADELRLKMVTDAVDRLEERTEEFELRLEHRLEAYEQRLERKFEDYLLKIVFNSHQDRYETALKTQEKLINNRINPLEKIVYGMIGLILVTVLAAVLATVVTST